jgi:hypothetical protein
MALKLPARSKPKSKSEFVAAAKKAEAIPADDLKLLSLEELADRASSIILQSKEMVARILLEGRTRFKSNPESRKTSKF